MLLYIALGAGAFGLYKLAQGWRAGDANLSKPEIAPLALAGQKLPVSAFVTLPQGGVGLTAQARSVLAPLMQSAGIVVLSIDMQSGVTFIGPPSAGVDPVTGGASALDTIRVQTQGGPGVSADVWISTLAAVGLGSPGSLSAGLPGLPAEMINTVPGVLPNMEKNEPPVAGSPAMAADISHPSMVLFAKAGDSF